MGAYIVTQRADGRGGFRPFGSYSSKQAGATVEIGDRRYKVTKDGRVNIPKAIMETYGAKGDDGRFRIQMRFSTMPGKDGWKDVKAHIQKPDKSDAQKATGDRANIVSIPMKERGKQATPVDSDIEELYAVNETETTWS